MTQLSARLDRVYEALVEDEDARVCKDIPDEACRVVPGNFLILVLSNTLTKVGDALSSPKTVLAWLMAAVQAPPFLVAFLVPLRESGSMLPQLFIARKIRRMPMRKWAWILGSVLQGASIAGIGLAAWTLSGSAAGWAIVGCLSCFSLSRGICSVAHKDLLGKTIPKTRRGRLTGISASVSGALATGVGLFIIFQDEAGIEFYGQLVAGAALLWVLSAVLFSWLDELPGETGGGGNAIEEAVRSLRLLKDDRPFRRFVIARALLMASALAAPYVVLLGQRSATGGVGMLGSFIVAEGLASSLSSPVWGRFADRSSRNVLGIAGAIVAALGSAVFAMDRFAPEWAASAWTYPAVFFILGIAHSGVRVGRKTYVVDMASGNKRTDYVAVSNTIIGAALLLAGSLGALSTFLDPAQILLVLAASACLGALLTRFLPHVQ